MTGAWTPATAAPTRAAEDATASAASAAAERWPAVVIGGGPAGAAAAITLARAGAEVLLVERRRDGERDAAAGKVCGGCLNARSVASLAALGLGELMLREGRRLDRVAVSAGGRTTRLTMGESVALGRHRLDPALRRAAEVAGATVRRGCSAELGPFDPRAGARRVRLRPVGGPPTVVAAGVVVLADGLAGTSLRAEPAPRRRRRRTLPGARIGIGTVAAWPAGAAPPPGELLMLEGDRGYLGVVRLAGGLVDLAAAVEPAAIARAGGAADWAADALRRGGLPDEAELAAGLRLHGTPRLATRSPWAAVPGVLRTGDGLAYAEPFSGEGIGWALDGGVRAGTKIATALAATGRSSSRVAAGPPASVRRGLERRWRREAWRIRRRQDGCRAVAGLLRTPAGRRGLAGALAAAPAAARLGMRAIGRDPRVAAAAAPPPEGMA